ncbi:MAG: hypothetical protein KGJ09_10415, partial [Candidatus Omnitrophica bacterium]|nr:hypothetical protein [Candidatus Omnitrophota bacterium]MDE2215459.1 hypothetical protein [Candidatus Omnitrophota bacterium]
MKANKTILFKLFAAGVFLYLGIVPAVFADIVINVVAVNATNSPKTSPIKFDLPGELTPEDILDTNGLQLDYSVDD